MSPTGTTSAAAGTGCSDLDRKIEEAINDYTDRVRHERPYEDTVGSDELRRRYDKK